jgi:hypothetical protein
MVWCGARHGRVVTTAVRAPVRPATRGRGVIPKGSASGIPGRIVVSRQTSFDVSTGAQEEPGIAKSFHAFCLEAWDVCLFARTIPLQYEGYLPADRLIPSPSALCI